MTVNLSVIMQISSVSTIYITPSGYHLLTCSDAHVTKLFLGITFLKYKHFFLSH